MNIDEIRKRHEADERYKHQRGYSMTDAHADRGILLNRIQELEKRLNDKRLLVSSSTARAAKAFDRIKELELAESIYKAALQKSQAQVKRMNKVLKKEEEWRDGDYRRGYVHGWNDVYAAIKGDDDE